MVSVQVKSYNRKRKLGKLDFMGWLRRGAGIVGAVASIAALLAVLAGVLWVKIQIVKFFWYL